MSEKDATVSADGIGGIDNVEIPMSDGTTVLSGSNATNRTSVLNGINAALGGTMALPNINTKEGHVELTLCDAEYTRRVITDEDGNVSFEGSPATDDPDLVNLYATLTENNPIRTAVESAASSEELTSELREMLMAPVDDDEIRQQVRELKQDRRNIRDQLEEMEEAKARLPTLKQRRQKLQTELSKLEQNLKEKREAIESSDTNKEQSEGAKELLNKLETAERDEDRIAQDLQDARESLEAAREERERIKSHIDELEGQIDSAPEISTDRLNSFKQERDRLKNIITLLSQAQRASREVVQEPESIPDELRADDDETDVLDQLVESQQSIECWTCGSVVSRESLDKRREELENIISTYRTDAREIKERITRIREKREKHQQLRADLEDAKADLLQQKEVINRYESKIERLEQELREQRELVEGLQEQVDDTEEFRDSEILNHHKEVRELSRKQGRLERDLSDIENTIEGLQQQIREESELRGREEGFTEKIEDLNGCIDRLEREVVDTLQEYLDELVNLLEYENIGRIRVDRISRDGEPSQFRLTVVREGLDGGKEDERGLRTLSESERSLVGLVIALAGYQAHSVADEIPMLLLDSIEEFDSERINHLIDYIAKDVPRIVVALLPEDANNLQDNTIIPAKKFTTG